MSRRVRWSLKPNQILVLAISVAVILLMLVSRQFFGAPQPERFLKAGLDSYQIRRDGMMAYNTHCIRCHGVEGRGSSFGPPLVHALYARGTFADQAFAQAVLYGVKARLWDFGDMEPVAGVTQTQIAMIMAYIRMQQDKADLR